jgi:hypothetical protein
MAITSPRPSWMLTGDNARLAPKRLQTFSIFRNEPLDDDVEWYVSVMV